jgi:hypothetical protein
MPLDPDICGPGDDGVRSELGAVVGDNHDGLAAPDDDRLEFADNASPRDRGVRDRGQALARDIVDNVQHPNSPAAGQLVMDKVEAPALVRQSNHRRSRARADSPLAPFATTNRQPLFAVEALCPFPVSHQPLLSEQNMEAPITEPAPFGGKLTQPRPQRGIVRSPGAVSNGFAIRPDQPTRPTLAHAMNLNGMSDGLSPDGGRHHFFEVRSFRTALSSIASASSFFSRTFSSSRAFKRLASDTAMPPNFAFQA